MLQRKQPKLCPNCPLSKAWKDEALKRIRQSQYTKEKEEPSNLKICMERRKILKELGSECPHYQNETLTQNRRAYYQRDKNE